MLFKRLELKNLLSFRDTKVDLRPLNVIIGPNASGKSNLIEVISLLQAAPTGLNDAIRQGGGARSWLSKADGAGTIATLVCDLTGESARSLRYKLAFSEESGTAVVFEESLSAGKLRYFTRDGPSLRIGPMRQTEAPVSESFFSVYKSPSDPTGITKTGKAFESIRIYRDFATSGARAATRHGISVSSPKDMLQDGGENLALMLQQLDFHGKMDEANKYLKRFWDRFEQIKLNLEGVFLQTYVKERGMRGPLSAGGRSPRRGFRTGP